MTEAPSLAAPSLEALEARAWEGCEGQRELLAALATALRAQGSALDGEPDLRESARRALDLLDALGVMVPALGEDAARDGATVARTLGRAALGDDRPDEALSFLQRAERYERPEHPADERAETAHDAALALERVGRGAEATERWRRSLELAAQCADPRARLWFTLRACAAIAASERARGDESSAARYDEIADLADDEDCARDEALLGPALDFYRARWRGDEPPPPPHSDPWLARSTGEVRHGAEGSDPPGGIDCERIFGPRADYRCACGALTGRALAGAVCDQCNVELARARRRRSRLGHIELPEAIVHPRALEPGPHGSIVGLALDVSEARVRDVLARERCLRWSLDRPRGADTVAPDAPELAAYDRGEGDGSARFATGEEALRDALESLAVDEAIDELLAERGALAAHRSGEAPAGRARLARIDARLRVLESVRARGAGAWCVRRAVVLPPGWIDARADRDAVRAEFRALASAAAEGRASYASSGPWLASARRALEALVARV